MFSNQSTHVTFYSKSRIQNPVTAIVLKFKVRLYPIVKFDLFMDSYAFVWN